MTETERHQARRLVGGWLDTRQVRELLGCSSAHVRRLVRARQLTATNVATDPGGRPDYRFKPEDVASFVENRTSRGAA